MVQEKSSRMEVNSKKEIQFPWQKWEEHSWQLRIACVSKYVYSELRVPVFDNVTVPPQTSPFEVFFVFSLAGIEVKCKWRKICLKYEYYIKAFFKSFFAIFCIEIFYKIWFFLFILNKHYRRTLENQKEGWAPIVPPGY